MVNKKDIGGRISYVLTVFYGMMIGAMIVLHKLARDMLVENVFDAMALFSFVAIIIGVLLYFLPTRSDIING